MQRWSNETRLAVTKVAPKKCCLLMDIPQETRPLIRYRLHLLEAKKQTPAIMAKTICCLAAAKRPRQVATITQIKAVTAQATPDRLRCITEKNRKIHPQSASLVLTG